MRNERNVFLLGVLISFCIMAVCLIGLINPSIDLDPSSVSHYIRHGLDHLKWFSFLVLITGLFVYELNGKNRI